MFMAQKKPHNNEIEEVYLTLHVQKAVFEMWNGIGIWKSNVMLVTWVSVHFLKLQANKFDKSTLGSYIQLSC